MPSIKRFSRSYRQCPVCYCRINGPYRNKLFPLSYKFCPYCRFDFSALKGGVITWFYNRKFPKCLKGDLVIPYIKQDQRDELDPYINALELKLDHPGKLNYIICKLALALAKFHGNNYSAQNTVIGAIECAKLEYYRRFIGNSLEEQKIKENGDIM